MSIHTGPGAAFLHYRHPSAEGRGKLKANIAKDMSRIVERMKIFSPAEIATLKGLLQIFDDVADERPNKE